MQVAVETVTPLRFDDGAPVRAASAVVPFGGGWLVAQDDATHAAWVHDGAVSRVRVLPAVSGLDTFEESAGTKHLKPDLEAGFAVPGPTGSVVLLGSGSAATRMRGTHVHPGPGTPTVRVRDLSPLYAAAAAALEVRPDVLNLEGACVVGEVLRWFQRGVPSAGVPTASVDLDLAALLAAVDGDVPVTGVPLGSARRYDLGTVDGVGLAVTDAVLLDDGTLLVSAAAEDTADPRDDGPVVGAVLAVLHGDVVVRATRVPTLAGAVPKIEGLALIDDGTARGEGDVRLLATVDSDDVTAASLAVVVRVRW